MSNEPDEQSEPQRRRSLTEGMPTFPDAAKEMLPPSVPSRARVWGRRGAIYGLFAGSLIGLLGSILEDANITQAAGYIFGAAFFFAAFIGISWGLMGLVRDLLMSSSEQAKRRQAEEHSEDDRDWHNVRRMMD